MSEENDKVKNINNSVPVNNGLPNPENSENPLDNVNIKPFSPMPDRQNVMPSVRINMVSKATDFLIADKIRNTPIERKVNFLRSRGLTEHEIQLSLQKAAAMYNDNQNLYVQTNDIPMPNPSTYNYLKTSDISGNSESWLRRLVGSVAIGATAIYIGYQIYKKYLENWLFGMKMSPVEKRLEVVELLVQRCIMLIEQKNVTPESSIEQNNRQKDLDQLRAELKSIKSLLLNRFQFPPAPAHSSIPQWQLVKNSKSQAESQNKTNDTDKSNSPQTSTLNGFNSTTVVPQPVDFFVSDTIKDKDTTLNNSKSNGITLPLNSEQHTINSHDVVTQNNSDKHNMGNEDDNQ